MNRVTLAITRSPVLDEFDRELERRGLRFARYADDSNIYVRSRRANMLGTLKRPRLGIRGLALRGLGSGRGLAAKYAVCVIIITV